MVEIKRNCVVCGKEMDIRIDKRGRYNPGHYFGKRRIPIKGTGKYIEIGKSKVIKGARIVKWTGKEKEVEHWECNKCYKKE